MRNLKALALGLALLCLPGSAFAGSVGFGNAQGTLAAINGGTALQLTGSNLVSITGLPGFNAADPHLGTFSFTTGSLTSGSLETTAMFGPGGTINIVSTNGVVFNGTFTSATWTPIPGAGPMNWGWTLTGTITGTLNGEPVEAATVQITTVNMAAKLNPFRSGGQGKINLSGGNTTIPQATPEVGTFSLLGIGLVGIALVSRVSRGIRHRNVA